MYLSTVCILIPRSEMTFHVLLGNNTQKQLCKHQKLIVQSYDELIPLLSFVH